MNYCYRIKIIFKEVLIYYAIFLSVFQIYRIALYHTYTNLFNDLDSVAALLKNLDLFITVSNSTAHLAGSLGVKTLLIKPPNHCAFHYWNQPKDNTPWYNSIKIMSSDKGTEDVINKISSIPYAFTEPFADSSQIPTMLVSELASKKVKVALSGDGGDELFGGYNRYIYANKYWKLFSSIPIYLRNKLVSSLKFYPSKSLLYFFYKFLHKQKNINHEYQIEKILSKLINIKDESSYYRTLTQEWTQESKIIEFKNY